MSTYLPDDISLALDRFMSGRYDDMNRSEAIIFVLRIWLMEQGFLDPAMPPDSGGPAGADGSKANQEAGQDER